LGAGETSPEACRFVGLLRGDRGGEEEDPTVTPIAASAVMLDAPPLLPADSFCGERGGVALAASSAAAVEGDKGDDPGEALPLPAGPASGRPALASSRSDNTSCWETG